MDCLCDFKEPTFGLSVQRCAACVEKDNDFISSKVDPQFWTPLCHHRNMTIQQFSLGIYNLGADNLLPSKLLKLCLRMVEVGKYSGWKAFLPAYVLILEQLIFHLER